MPGAVMALPEEAMFKQVALTVLLIIAATKDGVLLKPVAIFARRTKTPGGNQPTKKKA